MLPRPKNLIEARSAGNMIKRKLITQQQLIFKLTKKTINYNDNKYHHSERDNIKEHNYHICGKNWTPWLM